MVYYGYFNDIQVCFLAENVFMEKKQIIIKDARNCSDEHDRQVPAKILLKNLKMEEGLRIQIIERFTSKVKDKQKAKARKKLLVNA